MIRTVPFETSLKNIRPSGANCIDIGTSTPSTTGVILMSEATGATGVGVLRSFVSGVSIGRGRRRHSGGARALSGAAPPAGFEAAGVRSRGPAGAVGVHARAESRGRWRAQRLG